MNPAAPQINGKMGPGAGAKSSGKRYEMNGVQETCNKRVVDDMALHNLVRDEDLLIDFFVVFLPILFSVFQVLL